MFAVDLANGRRIYAYKHIATRNYVHVSADGHAYVYMPDGRYREIDPLWLLDEALEKHQPRGKRVGIPWRD